MEHKELLAALAALEGDQGNATNQLNGCAIEVDIYQDSVDFYLEGRYDIGYVFHLSHQDALRFAARIIRLVLELE